MNTRIRHLATLLFICALVACAGSEPSDAAQPPAATLPPPAPTAVPPTATAEPDQQPSTPPSLEPTTESPNPQSPIPNLQSPQWQRTNPGGGGAFNTIAAGPTGVILVASDLSGAYRSLDGGQTWDVIGSFRGLTATHVSGLGFDPADAAVLYLGTDDGVFRSDDTGESFSQVLSGGYVTDIVIAPANPQVGYVATHSDYNVSDGRIYKTLDDGLTWKRISDASLPSGLHILKLLSDPADADALYLLAGEGRFTCGAAAVYRSRDGGRSWTQLAADKGQIMDIALDRNNPNLLYITTFGDVWDEGYTCISDDPNGGYLYGSSDYGDSWRRLTDAPRNALIWLDGDDQHAIRLIDVDYPELWESADGGANWTLIGDKGDWETGWTGVDAAYGGSFNGDAKTLGQDMSDPDALLWVDSQFVWGTRDDGRTFVPLHTTETAAGQWQSTGVDNIVTLDVAINSDSSHIYLAMADVGCFRSDDGGSSWQNCNAPNYTGSWGANGGNAMTVAADPERPNVVWMSQANEIDFSQHTLLRSDDYGATWTPAHNGLPTDDSIPAGLSVDANSPAGNRTLFITFGGDVYRSSDDGNSWLKLFACGGCHVTAVSPFDSNLIFAGGEAGLWRSTDGGGSWTEVGGPEMRGGLGDEFYGAYWEGVATIAPDPVNAGWVYAAVVGENKGLYRSQHYGGSGSWQKILSDDFLRDAAVSPADPGTIFAASSSAIYAGGYDPASQGILISEDGGQTWRQANEGLAWPFANAIAIDPNNPDILFIGSPGAGYYKRDFSKPWPQSMFLPLVLLDKSKHHCYYIS